MLNDKSLEKLVNSNILDVENLPLSTIRNLSQGMKNEEEVMERFYGKREEWYANAVQF